jgi:hypothetical protein
MGAEPLGVTLVFLIGAPRSGTTMLERILSSHSAIRGGPEPHLLTPLAHLGVWAGVDKAPYDHIVAAIGQKDFVKELPHGEADYWQACRAYCKVLYERYMEGSGKTVCLDKTPEYATVLPFITKVLPDAKYVVLTRHPLAVFSSFANSFFDGDFEITNNHDPIMERYVHALGAFLRQGEIPFVHVRYEDLVAEPERWVEKVYAHIGVPNDPATVDYGTRAQDHNGLGDPIGIKKHARPSTESLDKWADELLTDESKLAFVRRLVQRLDPDALAAIGYPLETFWQPLERRAGKAKPAAKRKLDRYAVERKLIVHGRSMVQRFGKLREVVGTVRLACDVLLREY